MSLADLDDNSGRLDENGRGREQSCLAASRGARVGAGGCDMMKRIVLAVLAVFVAWSVMDIVIHGVILAASYKDTAQLWRPMEQMKMGLMRVVMVISASVFVCLYAFFVGEKTLAKGIAFGVVFGVGAGISMGYGTYAVMPITYKIAITWFLGTVAEATVAGLLVGAIVREKPAPSA
jgi:hypothetical protein